MPKKKDVMVAGGRGGRGNIVKKDEIAPPPAPMESSLEVETARDRLTTHGRGGEGNWYWHVIEKGLFKRVVEYEQRKVPRNRSRVVASGRGGRGNIVKKDKIAPPPAPMECSLEVETARDPLTTHGRGGEGNWCWRVLEKVLFKRVVEDEQRGVLRNRGRVDDGPTSPKSSPLDEGDPMGSPTSQRPPHSTLVSHGPSTENASEDVSMSSGRSSKLSLREPLKRILWPPTKRWRQRSTSHSSDNGTLSRSTTMTSVDLHFTPVTPIDGPSSPVSVASYGDPLPLLNISSPLLDIPSPALQYLLSSPPGK